MKIKNLLEEKERSILVTEERKKNDIVIASPHHSPIGKSFLPCKEHKVADEGVGFLVTDLAEKLECHSIVCCNYFIDSNKSENSDYFRKIDNWNPKLLIELHGHGGRNANFDIEISSGGLKDNKISIKFAKKLKKLCSKSKELSKFKISGNYKKIFFTASKSVTITTNKWISLHIELPKLIRKEEKIRESFIENLKLTVDYILTII